MEYYVCRNGQPVNILVWLGSQEIQGCSNALILEGGDLVLLKEVKRYTAQELDQLDWIEEFGSAGYPRASLRSGLRKLERKEEWLK